MKILIVGAGGMLGHKLVQVLSKRFEVWATCRELPERIFPVLGLPEERIVTGIDVLKFELVKGVLERITPDIVINAAGVIKQRGSSKDVITALSINSIFPQRLAAHAGTLGYRTITISTDCVFDGADGCYSESDIPNALDLYGQSKRWGEIAGENCLTLRTSIIGHEINTHHSLIDWFLSNRGGSVDGFVSAIYSGFPTVIFADIITDLIENYSELNGLYHVSSEPINKFELLKLVNEVYGAGIEIRPSDRLVIDRSLDCSRFAAATGFRPRPWNEMIRAMHADFSANKELYK